MPDVSPVSRDERGEDRAGARRRATPTRRPRRRASRMPAADAVGAGVADARRPRRAIRACRAGAPPCSPAGRRARATSLMPPGALATWRSTANARSTDCTVPTAIDQPISSGISDLRRVDERRAAPRRRRRRSAAARTRRAGVFQIALARCDGVEAAVFEPLLVARVVGGRRAVEGVLEVGERVRGAEEVLARVRSRGSRRAPGRSRRGRRRARTSPSSRAGRRRG